MDRNSIKSAKRCVVKIGSALLTNNGRGLDNTAMAGWVEQIAELAAGGKEIVLVSSGAVAEGIVRLGWQKRPVQLHQLQAAAAVGQMGLIQAYEQQFQRFGIATAQILLDHDDMASRGRYLNARNTLQTLIELKVIPVVNENDTVVTDEIRFGDNDSLAALVANLIDADLLIILTDKDGLFDADPGKNPQAQLIECAQAEDRSLDALAGDSASGLGRGGMITKLRAARLAARSGCNTVIAGGRLDSVLTRVAAAENVGTLLMANQAPLAARKQWLAGQLQLRGKVTLDQGAVNVLCQQGKSLLPIGVVSVQGQFGRGDLISCNDQNGREIARGLVNYNSDEASKIIGKPSDAIQSILGYCDDKELIHRDNLVII